MKYIHQTKNEHVCYVLHFYKLQQPQNYSQENKFEMTDTSISEFQKSFYIPDLLSYVRKHRSSNNIRHSIVPVFIILPRLGSQNRPTVPPLNIAIIPWWKLGHTVLVFKAGSHSWFQSRIHSCIKSCAGVKNRL